MSFYITYILVLVRKLLSTLTYLQEVPSRTKPLVNESHSRENPWKHPLHWCFYEFPEEKEEVEPSPDQQEEAHATESETPSNSFDDLVAKQPPI